MQSRSITWISVKTPRNLDINSLFEITLDRQLPSDLITLDVLHNVKNKQPQEMIIPLLNTVNSDVKLPKNTVLGSITKVENAAMCRKYVLNHNDSPLSDKTHDKPQPQQQAKPLLAVFPDHLSFQTHAHMTVASRQYNCKMQMFHQKYNTNFNTMLNTVNLHTLSLSLSQILEEPTK